MPTITAIATAIIAVITIFRVIVNSMDSKLSNLKSKHTVVYVGNEKKLFVYQEDISVKDFIEKNSGKYKFLGVVDEKFITYFGKPMPKLKIWWYYFFKKCHGSCSHKILKEIMEENHNCSKAVSHSVSCAVSRAIINLELDLYD